jgi:hypothetical protein
LWIVKKIYVGGCAWQKHYNGLHYCPSTSLFYKSVVALAMA